MAKFSSKRNVKLKLSLDNIPTNKDFYNTKVPEPDTVNRQGFKAYSIEDELRLLSMLNTLKVEPQFYRSESEQMKELQELVEKLDPYFVAQCIIYSRCMGEGMRSINHIAAACLAPKIGGLEWSKRFYSLWDKKAQKGGCIFRPDDMNEIKAVYSSLGKSPLSNAMKKGFASVIENLDSYSLLKYKKTIRDIANLCHPKVYNSKAVVDIDGVEHKAIEAVMKNLNVSADTWEVAQSEAGQIVAKAVKEGKLSEDKAKEVLKEAKNTNWLELLNDNKLGILAALRNLSNMLLGDNTTIIDKVCTLITNDELLKKGKIMPYQMDLAYETVSSKFNSGLSRQVIAALNIGLEKSVSNLTELLTGRNLVILDCSGSMYTRLRGSFSSCLDKAALIAAMICKASNADLIRFGSFAEYTPYNPTDSVFTIAEAIRSDNFGCTNLGSAFDLITKDNKIYDRIFILSDDECNQDNNKTAYKRYLRVANPYIYSIDLAAYGTKPISSDKVHYYFGYGYSMFDDIATAEFKPETVIDKVKAIVI